VSAPPVAPVSPPSRGNAPATAAMWLSLASAPLACCCYIGAVTASAALILATIGAQDARHRHQGQGAAEARGAVLVSLAVLAGYVAAFATGHITELVLSPLNTR
jgi:hypothetical protein